MTADPWPPEAREAALNAMSRAQFGKQSTDLSAPVVASLSCVLDAAFASIAPYLDAQIAAARADGVREAAVIAERMGALHRTCAAILAAAEVQT